MNNYCGYSEELKFPMMNQLSKLKYIIFIKEFVALGNSFLIQLTEKKNQVINVYKLGMKMLKTIGNDALKQNEKKYMKY